MSSDNFSEQCKICKSSKTYKSLNGLKNHCVVMHSVKYSAGEYRRIFDADDLKTRLMAIRKGQGYRHKNRLR